MNNGPPGLIYIYLYTIGSHFGSGTKRVSPPIPPMSSSLSNNAVDAEALRREMESQEGAEIWQSMWDTMLRLIQHKGKRWLWEFMNPNQVHCACVWAPGNQEHLQATPVTQHEHSEWWPVLVSIDPEYVRGDLYPVMCLPLLNGGCHLPWWTHRDRIVIMPVTVRSLPGPASGPPVAGPPPGPPAGPPPGPPAAPMPSTMPREATNSHADSSSSSMSAAGPPAGPPPGPPVAPMPSTIPPGQATDSHADSSSSGMSADSWDEVQWDMLD